MTEEQLRLWVDQEAKQRIAQSQSQPDPVLPEHIADRVLFLAADVCALCSAQNFIVDGGWVR